MEKKKSMVIVFQIILVVLAVLLFLWYLAPFIKHRILCVGNAFGFALCILIGLFGVFLPKILDLFSKNHTVKNIFIAIIIFVFALVAATFGSMFFSQNTALPTGESTVVVLGCEVKGDHPSGMLRQRIEKASEYLKENKDAVAVLSGGQGKGEKISEAQCMKNELIKRGIDEKRLYLEDKSTSTDENVSFSEKLISKNNLSKNVVVITSDYHEKRALLLCKKYSLKGFAKSSKTEFYLAGTYWLREILALMKEFVF